MTTNDAVFENLQNRILRLEQQMEHKNRQLTQTLEIVEQLTTLIGTLTESVDRIIGD